MKTNLRACLRCFAFLAAAFTQTAFSQTWQTVFDCGPDSWAGGIVNNPTVGAIFAAGSTNENVSEGAIALKNTYGQSEWTLVDLMSSTDGVISYSGITVDANGTLFAAVDAYDANAVETWLVRRSVDGGGTWNTVDVFTTPGSQYGAGPRSITCDGHDVYVSGFSDLSGKTLLIIRKTSDGGNTWFTVFQTITSVPPGAGPIVFAHPTLGVFLAGKQGPYMESPWLVQRSRDGGATWATVDQYQLDKRRPAGAYGMGADSSGNLYVIGEAGKTYKSGTQYYWTVRKSSNGGNTWTTIDSLPNGSASCIGTDVRGNLFVCGKSKGVSSSIPTQWLVRRCAVGSSTWTTADSFQLQAGYNSEANSIAADPFGNVFVSGAGSDANGWHWIVRKLSAAP